MPTNKHAIIRYQALDRCFSNRYRKYYIDDLIEACNKALEEFYCPKENDDDSFYVKRRTIFNDIAYMESPEGWNAPVERIYEGHRCYYRYQYPDFSINRREFSEGELDILDDALVMLERFKGAEGFDWIDEFVTNFQDKLGRRRNTVPVIGYQGSLEMDERDNYHCGNCLVPYKAVNDDGLSEHDIISIEEMRPNTRQSEGKPYPLYAVKVRKV